MGWPHRACAASAEIRSAISRHKPAHPERRRAACRAPRRWRRVARSGDRREGALAAREAAVAARELVLDAEVDRYATEAGWRGRLFSVWRQGHPNWRAGAEAMFPAW
jgi:hypothetical protein